ncbi:MAG: glycosyltransferase family 2 protein [Thermoplasmataceae archaeon]
MGKTAIVFSNNDLSSVKRVYPIVHNSSLDQIIWAIDGNESIPKFIESFSDNRDVITYSPERQGKSASYNRALRLITNDDVFLISADVVFQPDVFDRICERVNGVGVALTNVVPMRRDGIIRNIGSLLWIIRDTQLRYFFTHGIPIHGGEFLYLKRKFIEKIPEVVNDDAYQCLNAQKHGAMAAYYEDLEIRNFVPSELMELINQRRRINYGHIELGKKLENPSSISSLFFRNTKVTLSILRMALKRNLKIIGLLPFLLVIEVLSRLSAQIDMLTDHDQILWKNIETSKS